MVRLRYASSVRALFVLVAFFCLHFSLFAEPVENLKPTDYVNDFAGVLSPQTVSQLDAVCSIVYRRANAQVVVFTIKSLDGAGIDDFAVRLEEKWKLGRKGSDRGVLIIIAVQDHKYRIEVGYGLESILPDAKAGDIGRQMVPSLKQGDYDSAVRISTLGVAQVIAADAGIDLSQQARPGPSQQQQQIHLSPLQTVIGGAVLLVVLFLLARSGLLWFLLGMFFGGRGGGFGGGGGGFGGGGGGGFGDGGGGFSGGEGGSSGGGGASGSW